MTEFFLGDLVCFDFEAYEHGMSVNRQMICIIVDEPLRAGGEVTSKILDNLEKIYEIYLDHPTYGPVDILRRYKNGV